LAFSLVLYPTPGEAALLPRMTALGAIAVSDTLHQGYALPAEIKWPNDVLVARKKVAGVLVEAQWTGDYLQSIVLGIGMNVAPASVDEMALPAATLRFPAICLEEALGRPVDRLVLLHSVLEALFHWHSSLSSVDFMQAWEMNLAFRGEWVQVISGEGGTQGSAPVPGQRSTQVRNGQVLGLASDGSLKLLTNSGGMLNVQQGEISLRPLYDK
jgi:BirA family biotin operon repressor/biotin-[acetyl-CoA-carboxylase] ligase